ncbi:hypothetical protein [Limnohabitans sp.]|uniref:hypothetical protein n=1 Tax=Limnohabitans sp. TaxID=1907725 RepID=UPI00286EB575|nr:hypothetical protein [Limnohabitans sp.]
MRYSIWQSVKVANQDHPRDGQAGTVQTVNHAHPDEVVVKFDNGDIEAVAVADLQAL